MQEIVQLHFDAGVLLLIAVLIVIRLGSYSYDHRPRWPFWIGMLIFSLCAGSPIRFPLVHLYFSLHMIAHVLIILVAAPFLLLEPGSQQALPAGKQPGWRLFLKRNPLIAWVAGMATMWFWHIPFIFNLAHASMQQGGYLLSFSQTSSLLFGGMVFCSPLLGRPDEPGRASLAGLVYLFTACIACSLLGLMITFAPPSVYQQANIFSDLPGMAEGNILDLSARQDQEAAGLIMWVPCCLVYLSGCLYIFNRWFTESEPMNAANGSLLNIKKQKWQ